MKKLLTGLLALLTCFTCATAVACGDDKGDDSSSTPPASESSDTGSSDTGSSDTGSSDSSGDETDDELADAAAYLEELYRDKDAETRADYEILPAIWGYNIAWSVTLPEGVTEGVAIVVNGDKVTVDVNELLDEDLEYVLTGVVSNEAGQSVTVSFTRVVLAAPSMIPQAITEAPVEGVAYKYHVYQSTLAKDLYFAGGMAATYYFSTTEDSAAAVDVYAEYVAGSTTEFYLYFNHTTDGKQYLGVRVSEDGAHDNIVYTSEKISTFVWNETLGTVTTHLEATKNNGGPNDFYFGNYGDKTTISASYTSYAGGAGNNVGHLVTMVDRNSITPEKKVAEAKEGLTLASTEITGAKEVELPAARYVDVIVTWAISENAYASIVDGKIVTTNPAEDTAVTLTATLTCGDVTDTKEFALTLKHASDLPAFDTEITIPQANAIGEAQAANVLTEGKYYVSGVVTEVKNTQYGNLYIEDADGNRLYVYGCYDADGTNRYDAMANAPQVGDTVKLYSAITSYNGSAQLKNAWVVEWTPGSGSDDSSSDTGSDSDSSDTGSGDVDVDLTTPEAILNALYALNDNESLEGSFTLTGKITALDSYNNPTIVVEGFENMPVYCYKLVVSNAVGDVITVTATSMKNYKGTYEFMNCTLVNNSGDSSSDTGSDSDSSDTGSGDVDEVVKATGDSFTVESYASDNGWAKGTLYTTIEHESYTLSVSATPVGSYGQNSGKYYTSSENSGSPSWRIYQTENATITFTAAEGKTIASIKITYDIKNTGILTFNGANVASDEVVTVNGATATFGVGQTGTATNGQVQIQAIEVIFAGEEAPTYTLTFADTEETLKVAPGATLELPTPTAPTGKEFVKWVYYTYEYDEVLEWEVEVEHDAPATMPENDLTLVAVWKVIPYTITVTLPNSETVVVKIGVESVYNEETWETEIYDYTYGPGVEFAIETALKAFRTETKAYEVEGLTYDEEENAVFAELKNYEFTAKEVERVYTIYLNRGEAKTYKFGDSIQLPTPDAIDGAEFKGWVYYTYEINEETGEEVEVKHEVTEDLKASPAIDEMNFLQVWDVEKYTLTLNNVVTDYVYNEETETWEMEFGTLVINFGVMTDSENGIDTTLNELSWLLESNLPEGYKWDNDLPETWALQNYVFTAIDANLPKYELTLVNDGVENITAEYYAGKTISLPTPTADGKTFLGWFNGENKVEEVTMPESDLTLTAKWEVNVYTLTIVNGETSTEFTFGVEKVENRTAYLPSELKGILEANLPADAIWVEAIPETFELKDYTFTVKVIETLTIPEAIELGATFEKDNYTAEKYYVVGTIKNVYNATYGNMYIADEEGNELCIYGLYSADGEIRYDAMETKPVVGDKIKVCGVIGFYTAAQMKSGYLVEHIAHTHNYNEVVTNPTCTMDGYTTHTCSICNDSYKDNEVTAPGHSYEDGTCSVCGATEGVVVQYEKITSASEFTTGTYVLVVNSKNVTVSTFDGSWIKGSTLTAGDIIDKTTGDPLAITLEVSDAGVKIKIGSQYVKPKAGNNNGIQTGDYTWAYEFQADGTVVFKGVGSDTTVLAYNVQNAGFRAYKTSTVGSNASGYPSFFTAYKLVD